jgi:hypothetical protein
MKTGKSIQELAQTVQDIKNNMHDYIVPLGSLTMEVADMTQQAMLAMQNGDKYQYSPSTWAHQQLATLTTIPQNYYKRIQEENPALFCDMVNHGFNQLSDDKNKHRRMLRTVGGNLRAMVSPRYRRLDNHDFIENLYPKFMEHDLEVVSCELTDRRLYLKAVSPRLKDEVKVGDVVQYGLVISNSDVGCGSVRVEPLTLRLRCTNGMISNSALKKFHIGALQDTNENMEVLTHRTRELADAATWSEVKDVVEHSLKHEVFQSEINKLREADGQKIEKPLDKVVELACKDMNVTRETSKQSILSYLANGADGAGHNKWGLANAFTHAAQAEDIGYDEATDLERAGGKIIELPRNQWERIAV